MLLELSQVSKSFFGVRVLHEVDLSLDAGEVHAVVGENGAGKSTLMKIASGVYQPDSGTIRLAGQPVTFRGPRDAQAAGIGIIHQEFNLLPERTVAQNVFLGHEPSRRGFVDRKAMQARTAELLASVGADDLAPDVIVGRLGVAQQQIVEIVKALALDARVLIMDEPTASLADHEVRAALCAGTPPAAARHRHRLRVAPAHRGLRSGRPDHRAQGRAPGHHPGHRRRPHRKRWCATWSAASWRTTTRRGQPGAGSAKAGRQRGRQRQAARHRPRPARRRGGRNRWPARLRALRAGAGAVRRSTPFTRGQVLLDGAAIRLRSPRAAVRAGIAYVTEDRKAEGSTPAPIGAGQRFARRAGGHAGVAWP